MGTFKKIKKISKGGGLFWVIKKRFLNKKPAYVEIIPLLRCNLNCKKCHQKGIRKKPDGKNELDYEKMINIVKNLKKFDVRKVSFLGGEIMLMKDVWKILDLFEKEGIFFDLGTNGTLIKEEWIEKLAKYNNLFGINLSIDGFEKTHDEIRGMPGAWLKTLTTTLKLKKSGIDAGIVILLQKRNISEIPRLVEFLTLSGLNRIQIMLEGQTDAEAIKITKEILPESECDLIESDLDYSLEELVDTLNKLRDLKKRFKKLQLGLPPEENIRSFYQKTFREKYFVSCSFVEKKCFLIDWNGNLDFCCFLRNKNFPNLTFPLKENPFKNKNINLDFQKAKDNNLFPICERCFMIEKKIRK